jgi:hypothetical protein
MQFSGSHGLVQGVGFEAQISSYFGDGPTGVKQTLNLRQDWRGKNCRASAIGFRKKSADALFPIYFHAPHDTDFAHPESPTNLGLAGAAVYIQLTGYHPESPHVVNIMRKDW